jgi:opacity protein-like surface antigen
MKNIVLSAVAVAAMSSFAVAGGDIAPVEEPIVVVEEPVVTDSGFYLGLAYSYMELTSTVQEDDGWFDDDVLTLADEDLNTGMLQVGYKFNPYIAVEGRYWFGGNDTIGTVNDAYGIPRQVDYDVDTWAIYVKPMYPVTDAFDIYALLGYADNGYELSAITSGGHEEEFDLDTDIDGFSWGIGAAYSFNENFSIFVDYTVLYDDENDINVVNNRGDLVLEHEIDSINVGVT